MEDGEGTSKSDILSECDVQLMFPSDNTENLKFNEDLSFDTHSYISPHQCTEVVIVFKYGSVASESSRVLTWKNRLLKSSPQVSFHKEKDTTHIIPCFIKKSEQAKGKDILLDITKTVRIKRANDILQSSKQEFENVSRNN